MNYPVHGIGNDLLLFTLVALGMICATTVILVRARLANQDRWRGKSSEVPPLFDRMLDRAMQQRDERHRRLRERVDELERIATETHKTEELAREMATLKDRT